MIGRGGGSSAALCPRSLDFRLDLVVGQLIKPHFPRPLANAGERVLCALLPKHPLSPRFSPIKGWLRDAALQADHHLQVTWAEVLFRHSNVDGVDRIRCIDRPVAFLVRLNQRDEDVEVIVFRSPGLRIEQRIDESQRGLMIRFVADRAGG